MSDETRGQAAGPTVGEFSAVVDMLAKQNLAQFAKLVELRAANPQLQTNMLFNEILLQLYAIRFMLMEGFVNSGMVEREPARSALFEGGGQ